MNTKLHAIFEAEGRPIRFFMTTGQVIRDVMLAVSMTKFCFSETRLGIIPATIDPNVLG